MGKKAQDLWVLSVYVFECRGLDEAVGQGDQFYIAWYVFVKCTLRAEIVRIFFFLGHCLSANEYVESEKFEFL
jgi:hypothetical protein